MMGATRLYRRDDGEIVLELWAASTKHPDSVFHFSDFQKFELIEDYVQLYQWCLECASKLNFPFHAKELADFADNLYYLTWDRDERVEPAKGIDKSILDWINSEHERVKKENAADKISSVMAGEET